MVVTFVTYILTGGVLDASKAFTAMSLFNIMRMPMNLLPMMVAILVAVRKLLLFDNLYYL